jgi:hypothetical protein
MSSPSPHISSSGSSSIHSNSPASSRGRTPTSIGGEEELKHHFQV